MTVAEIGVNQAPIALLVGAITFVLGTWVGATWRVMRPRSDVGRRYVQDRKDITR